MKKIILVFLILITFVISLDGVAQSKRTNPDHWVPKILLPKVLHNMQKSSVIKQDFFLTLRDGIKLDCSKFYPSDSNPYLPDGYPTVLMLHGYGDRKETLEAFANAQAQYGYVVYTYSMRGQGNSQGLSNLISTTEAQDLIEFVNYVRQDFSTGLDTSKILIMGGSQGGIIPYMASTLGLNVKTIISSVTSPEFASSWIENGSIKMTFLWTISYTPDTARYNNQVKAMENWVYATGVKNNKWDSLARWVPFNRDFQTMLNLIKIPILYENSWQDYFFNTSGNIKAFTNLKNEYKTYFGAVIGHGGDVSQSENEWHMDFFNQWFYKFLWNDSSNFVKFPKYNLAYTTYPRQNNMWSFVHDSSQVWPPVGVNNLRFYFTQNNKLSLTKTTSTSYASFVNDIKKNNYTLQQAVYDEFSGTNFNNAFKKQSIYFETTPLTSNVKMIGTPSLVMKYLASANICQYNFQIYEVKANGEKGLVTRINYTDRFYTANSQKNVTIPGTAHGHIFQAGSKIRIELTNFDRYVSDSTFLGPNPYVLPVMVKSTNRIYYNDSYIELPVQSNGVNKALVSEENISNVESYSLEQNYPNPFNPVTKISFSIPSDNNNLVTLKIYDVTGKEVALLVNSVLQGGLHSINWDATRFSSGIYFYQLQAGTFNEVKKMILLK